MSLSATGPMPITTPPTASRPTAPRRLARGIGVLYLLLTGLAMVGPLTIQSLTVVGDPSATAANVAASSGRFALALAAWVAIVVVDVVIALGLYVLLRHVGKGLSMLAAGFRILYSVVMAGLMVNLFEAGHLLLADSPTSADMDRAQAALETFGTGFLVALVFFSVHLVLVGALFLRTSYLPRLLSLFVVLAGAGYMIDSLAKLTVDSYGGVLAAVVLTPAMIGEVGLALWLTIRGVSRRA